MPLRSRLALIVGVLLLLAAFTVEALGITGNVHAWLPPLSAYLEPTVGEPAALLACLATAAVVVRYGASAASRLSWGRLLLLTWLTGVVWGFAVALLRGWNTGIVAVLDHPDEYLMDVDRVDGVTSLLSIYTDNILLVPDQANFVTHNSGHPPLPLLSARTAYHDIGNRSTASRYRPRKYRAAAALSPMGKVSKYFSRAARPSGALEIQLCHATFHAQ